MATGAAAVLANAQPLLIMLPAWALYRERPSGYTLAGLVTGFTGLAATALPGGTGGGALLSIAAAAAITAGTLLARRMAKVDVVMLAGWQFLLGGLMLAAWAGAAEGAPVITWTPRFLASLAFLALIGTAATYLLWFTELQRAPLVTLSAWSMLTPVFGIAAGWLLLGQQLSTDQAVGRTLVLAALASSSSRRCLPHGARPGQGTPPLIACPANRQTAWMGHRMPHPWRWRRGRRPRKPRTAPPSDKPPRQQPDSPAVRPRPAGCPAADSHCRRPPSRAPSSFPGSRHCRSPKIIRT